MLLYKNIRFRLRGFMDFQLNQTEETQKIENILSIVRQSTYTFDAPQISAQNNIEITKLEPSDIALNCDHFSIIDLSKYPVAKNEVYLKAQIIQMIEKNKFVCEYQPIICIKTQKIHGYEALARFKIDDQPIPPNVIFNFLHQDLAMLFLLETEVKKFQIKHRPQNTLLFLNLDPDCCESQNHLNYWKSQFEQASDLVVEIIENTRVSNLDKIKQLMQHLNKSGISVALDDFGAADRLFCFDLLERTNYLKLDIHWFEYLDRSNPYKLLLLGLINFAKAQNIKCIFEGIETPQKLKLAEELGVDYVQGFLFREHFIQAQS